LKTVSDVDDPSLHLSKKLHGAPHEGNFEIYQVPWRPTRLDRSHKAHPVLYRSSRMERRCKGPKLLGKNECSFLSNGPASPVGRRRAAGPHRHVTFPSPSCCLSRKGAAQTQIQTTVQHCTNRTNHDDCKDCIILIRHAPRREPSSSPRHDGACPPSTLWGWGLV
jgi:hypothetical protein